MLSFFTHRLRSTPSPIDTPPNAILLHIFSFIPTDDKTTRSALVLVCRRWYHLGHYPAQRVLRRPKKQIARRIFVIIHIAFVRVLHSNTQLNIEQGLAYIFSNINTIGCRALFVWKLCAGAVHFLLAAVSHIIEHKDWAAFSLMLFVPFSVAVLAFAIIIGICCGPDIGGSDFDDCVQARLGGVLYLIVASNVLNFLASCICWVLAINQRQEQQRQRLVAYMHRRSET